jgi:hypothetical protein
VVENRKKEQLTFILYDVAVLDEMSVSRNIRSAVS